MKDMRLGWLLAALVVGLAGGVALGSDTVTVGGQLGATEQEADEGYFALGPDIMVVVKPNSALHQWLRGRTGRQVRLTIEVSSETQ